VCVREREFVGLGKVGSKGDGSGGSWQDRKKMNEERGDEFSKRESAGHKGWRQDKKAS
jgi:hypothetical protein